MTKKLSYKVSGVNRDTENETKEGMVEMLKTDDARVLNSIGAFATLFDGHFPEYKHPVLVLKTEQPGDRKMLAFKYGSVETICAEDRKSTRLNSSHSSN